MATTSADLKTVLVIEDDDLTREGFGHVLRRAGYSAPLVGNALEALHYLRHHKAPDAIMLDMVMPGADGWVLLREWASVASPARIPVLIVSAGQLQSAVGCHAGRPRVPPQARLRGNAPRSGAAQLRALALS